MSTQGNTISGVHIEAAMDEVHRVVAHFGMVAGIPFEGAAELLAFCQQLNFLRWLEAELANQIENFHEVHSVKGASYADLVRQRRITAHHKDRLERVLKELQTVSARPLPDFAQARMMEWAMGMREETAVQEEVENG